MRVVIHEIRESIGERGFQRHYRNLDLTVVGFSCRDPLHPKSRCGAYLCEKVIVTSGIHYEFEPYTDDHRKQEQLCQHTEKQVIPRNKRQGIDENADYQDDEYKARPAPRMESLLLSDVFNGKVFAAFVTEYRFVLGTVVFKRAPDILHKRDEKNISDKYCNFYYPFDQVSENPEICREKLFEQLCDQ